MQQLAKQGGEWQPPSQTAAKVSKARTPSLCTLEMVALPAWERKGSPPSSLFLSLGGASQYSIVGCCLFILTPRQRSPTTPER